MAVSYALRGKAHVAAATRARILQVADRLGYRPDPTLTHLMRYVRSRRIRRTQANLGVLMMGGESHYAQRLIAGVEARAEQLGYSIDKIEVAPYLGNPAALTRILRTRGIAGLLLPPCRVPQSLETLLDWSHFCVVAMSYSILAPRFHRVVPHHFHNALVALQHLRARGFERPFFAVDQNIDVRANHAFTGAHAWWAQDARCKLIPPYIAKAGLEGIRPWMNRHRPDALLVSGVASVEESLRAQLSSGALARLGIVVMDHRVGYFRAGIDQKTALIGATAVDSLVSRLHLSESGIPADATVCMIEGSWVEGVVAEGPDTPVLRGARRANK
ncbi:MAG: LacI family DNA-binding transcriptional regulator [Undibacterium sp.]|nr:LacI family DNA-binding transcriptional regulator [Opitutaceae bacterium]